MENAIYRGIAVEKKRRNNDNIATMNQKTKQHVAEKEKEGY